MKVGVVIVTYNNEDHIIETINSVKNQTLKDWTCVILDNGSSDRTFQVIQNHIEKDDNFKAFLKIKNEGPSAGRNMGYSKLSKNIDYIHFLDGDDVLKPEYLEYLTSYLDEHPEVGLAACQFDEIDVNSNYCGKGHRSRFAPSSLGIPRDIPLHIYKTPFVSFFSSTGIGPFGVYRKDIFDKTKGYVLESKEDTDMFCQMSLLAEVHYLPKYLYEKRKHTNNFAFNKTYASKHKLFREKWDFYQSDNEEINKLILDSLKYYYTLHKPFRDFKVSIKAFKEMNFNWSLTCFIEGVKDLIFRQNFKRIKRERERRVISSSQ